MAFRARLRPVRLHHSAPSLRVRPRYPWSRSRLGLAVREAILKATDLACDLRWPNDVLIQSKKCAGILTSWKARLSLQASAST